MTPSSQVPWQCPGWSITDGPSHTRGRSPPQPPDRRASSLPSHCCRGRSPRPCAHPAASSPPATGIGIYATPKPAQPAQPAPGLREIRCERMASEDGNEVQATETCRSKVTSQRLQVAGRPQPPTPQLLSQLGDGIWLLLLRLGCGVAPGVVVHATLHALKHLLVVLAAHLGFALHPRLGPDALRALLPLLHVPVPRTGEGSV